MGRLSIISKKCLGRWLERKAPPSCHCEAEEKEIMKILICWIIIISTLSFLSCETGRKLTKTDYILGTAFTLAKAGDAYTTMEGLDKGAIEQSPILGEHPSDGIVILSSIVFTGLMWLALKYIKSPNIGRTIVGANAGLAGVATMKNFKVIKNMK